MRVRTFKHSREELLEEGIKIVSSSSDSKYINRVTMVNLLLKGKFTAGSLSELSGILERTLCDWVKTADEEGFERLRAVKQTGRPSKLTEEQKTEIKDTISDTPEKHGYRVWDGPSLSDFISAKYGVAYGVRQCQRLFCVLGFSLQRPQTFPSLEEQNDAEREEFKKPLK